MIHRHSGIEIALSEPPGSFIMRVILAAGAALFGRRRCVAHVSAWCGIRHGRTEMVRHNGHAPR
ncbi:hypothetical protein IF2G_05457 [Cordyceps javanica]|nr:hypothetical protein IF2G_05457 [Cordyceps javanica]